MKIASLLAQYLYAHKRLDLPGIGSFLLDREISFDPELEKTGKPGTIEGIRFENNTGIKESPELINYIAGRSGKIRPLASADLDSHLELARQFLNIGKPFLFEGIGSLSRTAGGECSFAPGTLMVEKIKESDLKDKVTGPSEESLADYKSILYLKKIRKGWKRPLAISLMIAGLAVTIWGGYVIYKNTRKEDIAVSQAPQKQELVLSEDTVSAPVSPPVALREATSPGNFKFIVETANKQRGFKRYNYLRENGLNIKMETSDSVQFRLYFLLEAAASDTSHILDSLRRFYTPSWSAAYIQQ